jgi:hypothetical protein
MNDDNRVLSARRCMLRQGRCLLRRLQSQVLTQGVPVLRMPAISRCEQHSGHP